MENLHAYCAKVLPTIYDDTLSYGELLCKLTEEVNKLSSYETDIPNLVNDAVEKKFSEIDVEQELAKIMDKFYINVKVPPAGIPAAVGDGVTDDTEAIQGCIDYAAKNGGAVFFPSGTYISGQLVIATRVSLIGQDRYTTIVKLKAAANTTLLTGKADKFSLLNIGFDGSSPGQTETNYIADITLTVGIFSNVYFANGGGLLQVNVSKNLQINNAHFDTTSESALKTLGNGFVNANNLTFEKITLTEGTYFIDNACNYSCFSNLCFFTPAFSLIGNTGDSNTFDISTARATLRGYIAESGNYTTLIVNGTQVTRKISANVNVESNDVNYTTKNEFNVNAKNVGIATTGAMSISGNGIELAPGASGFTLPQPTAGDGYFDYFTANYPGGTSPFNFLVENERTKYIGADENRTIINAKYPTEITGLNGVVGDGVTDDSAALNALLNWCGENNAILVLPCECATASTVYLPTKTGIIGTPSAKITSIATGSNPVISANAGALNCFLFNLAISCADNQNAIDLANSNNGRYVNLVISGGGIGFLLSPTTGKCNNNVIDTVNFNGTNIAIQMVAENNTSVSQNYIRGFSGDVTKQSATLNRANNNRFDGLLVGATGTTINIALNTANGNVFTNTRGWIFATTLEDVDKCANFFDAHTLESTDQIHAERNAVIYCRNITGETFIGTNSNTVISRNCADAPSDFRHSAGSILFFRKTDADGYLGKLCTTAGTPGTWARFKFTTE